MEKNSNKGVIALLIVIIIILVGLSVLFTTNIIRLNINSTNDTEEIYGNEQTDNNEIVENDGFAEISLTNEEKKEINKELLEELKPTSTVSPFNSRLEKSELNKNIFDDDCSKLSLVEWYITFNNNANYETKQYEITAKDDNGNELTKIKYSRLADIAKEMFNVNSVSCDSSKKFEQDENGYVWLPIAGGGYEQTTMKIVSKYKKDNIYYDIIHVYIEKKQECYDVTKCIDELDDPTNEDGIHIKIKYGINNDNKKYLISVERID